jgi:hypothetical protein
MEFTDKELDMMIAKKIDRAVFYADNKSIFVIDFNNMITTRINKDEALKKQLLQLVLKSEE